MIDFPPNFHINLINHLSKYRYISGSTANPKTTIQLQTHPVWYHHVMCLDEPIALQYVCPIWDHQKSSLPILQSFAQKFFTPSQHSKVLNLFPSLKKKRMMKAQKIIFNTVLPEAKNGQHCKKAWAPQEGEPQLAKDPKVSYTSTIATSKVCKPLTSWCHEDQKMHTRKN